MRSGSSLVAAVFLLLSCSSPFPAAAPSWAAAKDHPDVPAILDRAEILLTHHGATHPATLKMFREDGAWKVGLVETFWSR
jgi:hypothetical protein